MPNPLNYTHDFKKVDFSKYKDSYTNELLEKFLSGTELSTETVRGLMYGYTFTKKYANHEDDEHFSISHWYKVIDKAERMQFGEIDDDDTPLAIPDFDNLDEMEEDEYDEIIDRASDIADMIFYAIYSTGDGKTPETAFCIIDTYQEYEMLHRLFGRDVRVTMQSLIHGNIDCIEFKSTFCGPEQDFKVYFDISRRFEVGY